MSNVPLKYTEVETEDSHIAETFSIQFLKIDHFIQILLWLILGIGWHGVNIFLSNDWLLTHLKTLPETMMTQFIVHMRRLYSHGLTLISAWINNYTHYKLWDEITCAWIGNYIPHFTEHMIIIHVWMSVEAKGAPYFDELVEVEWE